MGMLGSGHKPNEAKRRSRIAYNAEGRRLKNKIKKLLRHLKKLPDDLFAKRELKRLQG